MSDYNNPLEIFKKKEAVEYIGKSIDEAKSSGAMFSIDNIRNFVESSLFTKYIAFPNPIGGVFNVGYWSTKRVLRSLTREQLELLNNTYIKIDDQVKISLILSTINIHMASSLKKKTNAITDYGLNMIKYTILNLSPTKGLDKMAEKVLEKDKKYMWDLCKCPLALLLNYACYNKSCEHAKVKPILLDILQNAISSADIEDLCKRHFILLGNKTLQNYIVENFSDVECYYDEYNTSLPSLQTLMDLAKQYQFLIKDIE